MRVPASFDYIIAGAGSAGCVLAERLSADGGSSVLLLEEGESTQGLLFSMPKGFGKLLGSARTAHHYPTAHRGGLTAEVWVRGKGLGGSSAVNGLVWIRGQPADYDRIAELGNPGWSWERMLPYFRKLENHGLGESETRGVGGPIAVSTNPNRTRLTDALIQAGRQTGLALKHDQNQLDQEGIGYLQWNIDARGRRVSAARGFLNKAKGRPNLAILTGVRVDRVVLEGRQAIGIEGVRGGDAWCARARAEVVLAAGALGSPRILQLSGIGPGAMLQGLGVPVVHDSPRIGHNMREHRLLCVQYRLRDRRDSQNREYAGARLLLNVLRFALSGTGPMSWGSSEASAFVRAHPTSARPDVQINYAPYSLQRSATIAFEQEAGMQLYSYLLRPQSQGTVLLTSADPAAPLAVNPNYLAARIDRETSVAGVRAMRRIMAQPAIAPFLVGETAPTAGVDDDEGILDLFRRYGQSGYHAAGTAAMGPDEAAPLDARARVRGVQKLRVVDLSMLPELISGNTNAPAMALAWRAADLILEDRRAASRAIRIVGGVP